MMGTLRFAHPTASVDALALIHPTSIKMAA
jgi:hypothetical protein